MLRYSSFQRSFLILLLVFCMFSCEKEDDIITDPTEKVNNWIYEVMEAFYYWTDEMPNDVDKKLEPTGYFKSLLHQSDRFSVILPSYRDLINSLNGVSQEAGYELMFVRRQNGAVNGVIQYVKKEIGLRRGDMVTKINGIEITEDNYKSLRKQLSSNHSLTYERYDDAQEAYVPKGNIDLQVVVLNENPHHLDTVLVTESGKKVGYHVYNFFSKGPSGSNYDLEMENIYANFKAQGIDEMVVDLRYNGGGSVNSSVILASLLGRGIDESKIFFENKYNEEYTNYIKSLSNADQIFRKRFINKAENIGNNLSSNRIFFLTGRGTASASELTINGLKPFMQVFLIGRNTYGKNVGSMAFEDKDNKDNDYGLLPIIFRSYNSLGESDYGTEEGFHPDIEVNEHSFIFKALGDVEEPLLAQALAVIEGSTARISDLEPTMKVTPLISTIDQKQRNKQLILEDN